MTSMWLKTCQSLTHIMVAFDWSAVVLTAALHSPVSSIDDSPRSVLELVAGRLLSVFEVENPQ